jgi:hypothetical protein
MHFDRHRYNNQLNDDPTSFSNSLYQIIIQVLNIGCRKKAFCRCFMSAENCCSFRKAGVKLITNRPKRKPIVIGTWNNSYEPQKNNKLWAVAVLSPVDIHRRFRGIYTYCLHLESRTVSQTYNQQEPSTLRSSETSVIFCVVSHHRR